MMLLMIAMLAANGTQGLSNALPGEEQIRFVFVRHEERIGDRYGLVTGTSTKPVTWSGPGFYNVVRHCGGEYVTITADYNGRFAVQAASGPQNIAVARCVKAATGASFFVGVRIRNTAGMFFNREPFAALWDKPKHGTTL